MKEVYDLLKDAAGFTQQETDERFKITEENGEYVLKAYRYLDGPTFGKILRAILDKGGKYRKDETTKFAIFTLPKTPSPQAVDSQTDYKEAGNEIQTVPISALSPMTFRARVKPEFELEDLVESIKTYGILEPILVRRKGELYEIVAGERRVKAAKTAGLTEVPVIVKSLSDVDAFVIQLSENLQRKDLTEEEKSMALAELAKKTKWNAQQIADKIKMSYRWVCLYLPQDFKDQEKARAGALGGESKSLTAQHAAASLAPKPQDLTVPTSTQPQEPIIPKGNSGQIYKEYMFGMRQCEKCGKSAPRREMHYIDNLLICPECAGKTKPLTPRKLEEEPTFKPKEKPEFRRAVMQPQKSKPEMDLLTELSNRGITPETDKWICLWGTNPDGQYAEKKIVYYVHGEPHDKGKALNRDDEIKAALEKEGWTVFVFRHDEGTVKEWADKIEEALKW